MIIKILFVRDLKRHQILFLYGKKSHLLIFGVSKGRYFYTIIEFFAINAKTQSVKHFLFRKRREIFIQNLELEGLEIDDEDYGGKGNLKFAKLHAPLEVLRRYAEILKIRMPIRKFSTELLHSESAEGEDMLEFKLTQLDETFVHSNTTTIPLLNDVHIGLKSWWQRFQEPFHPSKDLMKKDPTQTQFTALYSR